MGSVLVEGGAKIFTSFLKSNLVDEWQFLVAPKIVGSQGLTGLTGQQLARLTVQKISTLGSDLLLLAVKK